MAMPEDDALIGTDNRCVVPLPAASLLHPERNTLYLLLALTVANVVLAVWRPKLTVRIR